MKVNGERIKQAREIRGLTQDQLAERVGVTQPYISYVEQNAESPQESFLEAVALATSFQASFFTRPSGPDLALGSLLYRRSKKLPSVVAAKVRQLARVAIELVVYLSQSFKPIPVAIPRANCDPAQAAQLARSAMGVSPDGPILGLMRKLERVGVLVVYLPTNAGGFDAFSAWSDEDVRRPVICLKWTESGDRLRRTLAHELGHLVLHQDFLGAEKERDQEADVFAGELLFPHEAMLQELEVPITLTRLAETKKRWGVSMSACAYYAAQRDHISTRQRGYLRKKLAARGWEKKEPIQIPVEYPGLLNQMVEARFPPSEAPRRIARDTGLSPNFVEELLAANRPRRQEEKPAAAPSSGSLLKFSGRLRA